MCPAGPEPIITTWLCIFLLFSPPVLGSLTRISAGIGAILLDFCACWLSVVEEEEEELKGIGVMRVFPDGGGGLEWNWRLEVISNC